MPRYFSAASSTVRLTGGSPSALQNTGDPFTLFCFFMPVDFSNGGLLTKYGGTNQWYMQRNSTGVVSGAIADSGGGTAMNGTVVTRPYQWYSAAFSHAGSGSNQTKIYINGILDTQGTAARTTHLSTDAFAIGGMSNNTVQFKGWIADAAVYRKALLPEEVLALHLGVSPRMVARKDLFGYWPLVSDGSEKDLSDNNSTLTVNASPINAAPDTRAFLKANQGRLV